MRRETIALPARIMFWCALLFAYAMAIIPGGEPAFALPSDKANHVVAFLTLSVLATLGWSRSSAWIIVVLLIAFGGFIEISQAMPLIHRDPEWDDWIADTIAVLAGVGLSTLALMVIRRRRNAAERDQDIAGAGGAGSSGNGMNS